MLFSTIACITLGLYSRVTITSYCADVSHTRQNACQNEVTWWTYLYLTMGTVFNTGLLVIFGRFYWKVSQTQSNRVRAGDLLD